MKLPFLSTLTAALLLPGSLAAAADTPEPAAPPDPPVSLAVVGAPLSEVLHRLSTDEMTLTAAPELRELKATVIVRSRPRTQVMQWLAQVFGAEWVPPESGGKAGRELRRRRDVSDWVKQWRRAYSDAEKEAREFQVDLVRKHVQDAFSALDHPLRRDENGQEMPPDGVSDPLLARFARTLPNQDLEKLIRNLAAISPTRDGGAWAQSPPQVIYRYRDLSAAQQRLLRDWLAGGPDKTPPAGSLNERRIAAFPDTLVMLGSPEGVAIEVTCVSPAQKNPFRFIAVSGAASGGLMDRVLHQALFKRLSRLKTPDSALLGAGFAPDGSVKPAVTLADDAWTGKPVADVPQRPLASELLPAVAKAAGLMLVADYHTGSTRLKALPEKATARQVLEAAADQFQLVVRQEDDCLLARNQYWPDRDDEETPAPWPERWIGKKRAGDGLSLEDLTVLGQLSEPRMCCLYAYRDGAVNFMYEIDVVRKNRWVLALARSLTPGQRRAAFSPDGLPVPRLDLRQRTLLLQWVGYLGASWERVHLVLLNWPKTDPAAADVPFTAQLKVPETGQIVWSVVFPPPAQSPFGVPSG